MDLTISMCFEADSCATHLSGNRFLLMLTNPKDDNQVVADISETGLGATEWIRFLSALMSTKSLPKYLVCSSPGLRTPTAWKWLLDHGVTPVIRGLAS